MSIFFLFLILLPCSFSNPLLLQPLQPPSLCLDGSPYAIYYAKGDINNILISFWGGGLCEGRNKTSFFSDCLARSKTELGSSKSWPESKLEESGFLSNNMEENPNFFNWHKFDFPYCDGSFHQGYVEEGVEVEGERIFIRGRRNVEEGIKFIINTIDLRTIKRVVVTGVSTGGYATFSWITNIEEIFKGINKDIEVYGIPDSGFFVDYYNYETKDRDYYIMNKLFYEIVNKESPPLTLACLKDHPNEQDLCLFPEYIFQYVKIPLLILQAGYDSSNLYETVGLHCVDGNTLANCDADSAHYAHIFKVYQNELIKQGIKKNKNFSVWAPACVTHGFEDKVHSSDWEVPMGSGFHVNKAVEKFLVNPFEQFVEIEDIKWPENKGCANQESALKIKL